jgi:hypothetical protein
MLGFTARLSLTISLAAVLGLALPRSGFTQAAQRDCTIRKEPNGLIRGDRVPSGCLLQSDETAPPDSLSDWPYPYIVCNEKFFYTPTVKKSVLANCVALSRGGMIIPTVPFAGVYESRDFGSLGPFDRRFGSSERHFGSLERPFGSLERPFGSSQRRSEPQRRSGSSAGPPNKR